ncbi:vacuolar protein sorting 11 [Haematobia irritans]|uniref:vacuolar protein sorting 11 n=1 Tax=Haematobia irritans TaxID=7368 RepID=UPI003F5095D7
MGVLEWKMCNFFKLEALNINAKYMSIKDTITTNCCNKQYKIFCNNAGFVYVFLGDWECISFQASNSAINFCAITDDSDLLAIHDEGSSTESLLKIYSVSKLLKRRPTVPVSSASLGRHCKITTLKSYFMDNQLYLAVGLDKGHVLLYKSIISRDISASAKTLHVCGKAIKGIEFLRKDRGELSMFVCADGGIFCYNIATSTGNYAETKMIIDDKVETLVTCCALKPKKDFSDEQYFVVGREDAVYCYTVEGRGPCFALKCSKHIVRWFGKHLIVVKSNISVNSKKRSQLIIINIENNMMVLNEDISEIECIFPTPDYDNCLIFTKDGMVYTLRDQEIRYKLHMLYSKNLYDIALKLVEGQAMYADLAANVFANYGDHLLQRGDIDESVKMYIKTIGQIPPFRVISKLLNFRYNEFLIQYLRSLVNTNAASKEYFDLLQNCDRRFELPGNISKIFRSGEYPNDFDAIDPMFPEKDISKYFPQDRDKGIELFSENGHWIVTHYPFDVGDIVKRILSNGLSSQQSIDIFIRVLLPLLLSNKECVLNVLNSLDVEYKRNPHINIIWAEILLQNWEKSSGVDVNELANSIKGNHFELSLNDVFIICRTHKYFPGIKIMYENFGLNALNYKSFLKCCFTLPLDTSAIDLETNKYSLMWMQTLSKENLQSAQSSSFVKYVLSKTLHCNPHYTLTILQKISANTNFNLSHLNKALPKDIFLKQFAFDNFRDIAAIDNKLKQIKRLLHDYKQKPMEFRNSKCDICKQPLKHPSIYYLCQHSYHKECLSSYSETIGCLACASISQKNLERRNSGAIVPIKKDDEAAGTLKNISHKLSEGVFSERIVSKSGSQMYNPIQLVNSIASIQDMSRNKIIDQQMKSKNPFEVSTNPFDDDDEDTSNQYDSNLNPFEE